MRKRLVLRLTVGFCCAIVALAITAITSEAGAALSDSRQEGPVRTDCQDCHASVVDNVMHSSHGQAVADSVFQEAWDEADNAVECLSCHVTNYDPATGEYEGDGITCTTCHFGQTGPHPETPMPTDPSSRLCGTCHIDTYAEWQTSAHGEGELSCVRCHNPHTATLKEGNMHDLCTTCHTDEGHFYTYTGHAQKGLTCVDCHLRVSGSPIGEGHGQRLHTFDVDLATCTQCHGQEMHAPAETSADASAEAGIEDTAAVMRIAYAPSEESACEVGEGTVIDEPAPQPAQPLNYLLVAAVGMGFGAAVTPVAENAFRRFGSKKD
jgi:formate-dependent nitrite reductase cytochrome c552 subunit